MKTLIAFAKKEITGHLRSGKLLLLIILFALFGLMNPATAKMTPWLMETMSDALAQSGINITTVTVSAMDSWMQFFKNLPMAMIAFVLLESNIFTAEYRSGTLILSLTKGFQRYKVILVKSCVLLVLWSVCYWLHFGISYAGSAIFWDNSIAQSLIYAAVCWWVFGLLITGLITLFSVIFSSNISVLLGVGGVTVVCYVLSMIPKSKKFLPIMLTDGYSLISGMQKAADYTWSLIITAVITLICFVVSIPLFNKKDL